MTISIPVENEPEKKLIQTTIGQIPEILIDVHEPEVIFQTLSQSRGLRCRRKYLKAGDYAFSNIGIERKQFDDYMSSLSKGRLWKQMMKIRLTFERPILAIEGLKDPTIQLQGLASIRFVSSIARIILMGITVVVLPTTAHFCYFIQYLFLSSDKKTPSLKPVPKKPWGRAKMEIKEDMLCMIPGIGRKTAKALMARYNNWEDLMRLSLKEIIQTTPLGPKKAKVLWEILHT